jgi:hypothetical protein
VRNAVSKKGLETAEQLMVLIEEQLRRSKLPDNSWWMDDDFSCEQTH